jgi:hypothetical protein
MNDHHDIDFLKGVLDGLSILTVIGALTKVLPAVAALFTIIWTGIRIYESNTVQSLIKRRKDSE